MTERSASEGHRYVGAEQPRTTQIMSLSLPLLQNLVLNSAQVFWSLFCLTALIGGVVLGAKTYWSIRQQAYLAEPATSTSTLERKYAPFQAQPHALSIRLLSTVIALALVLVVLAWTPLQQHLLAPLQAVLPDSEAIIDVTVTTQTPPKAPPAAPPPKEPQTIELVPIEPEPMPPEPVPDPILPSDPTDPGPITGGGGDVGEPIVLIYYEEPEPELKEVEPVLIAEVMPRFPGCEAMEGSDEAKRSCADQQLSRFIYSNIRYPAQAREMEVEGTVVLTFVVEKDGAIKNIKLLRDPGAGLGKEALRVMRLVQQYPERWTPGKQRGRSVPVRFNMPINFRLNE